MILADLLGYQRARSNWRTDPIAYPEPVFDWTLFATRVAIGAITGALAAAGITVSTEGA